MFKCSLCTNYILKLVAIDTDPVMEDYKMQHYYLQWKVSFNKGITNVRIRKDLFILSCFLSV